MLEQTRQRLETFTYRTRSAVERYFDQIQKRESREGFRILIRNAEDPLIVQCQPALEPNLIPRIMLTETPQRLEPVRLLQSFFHGLNIDRDFDNDNKPLNDPLQIQLFYAEKQQAIQNGPEITPVVAIQATYRQAALLFHRACRSLGLTDRHFENPIRIAQEMLDTMRKNNQPIYHVEALENVAKELPEIIEQEQSKQRRIKEVNDLKAAARAIFTYHIDEIGGSMNYERMEKLDTANRIRLIDQILNHIPDADIKLQARIQLERMKKETEEKEQLKFKTIELTIAA